MMSLSPVRPSSGWLGNGMMFGFVKERKMVESGSVFDQLVSRYCE